MDVTPLYEVMVTNTAWIPRGVKVATCLIGFAAYCRWAWLSSYRRRK